MHPCVQLSILKYLVQYLTGIFLWKFSSNCLSDLRKIALIHNQLVVTDSTNHVKIYSMLAFAFPTVLLSELGKTRFNLRGCSIQQWNRHSRVGDVAREVMSAHSPTVGSLIHVSTWSLNGNEWHTLINIRLTLKKSAGSFLQRCMMWQIMDLHCNVQR